MNAPIRIAVSVLAAGLLLGAGPPAEAASPGSAVVAKAAPLLKKKCHSAFRVEKRRQLLNPWAAAYDYYETHKKAEMVMYDNLRWYLADPNSHELIPQLEAGAAQFLEVTRPIVTKDRDATYKKAERFQARYLSNGCLTADGRPVFKQAMRYWRKNLADIYKAEERLFAMNMAIQTAQADLAGHHLQDAELEIATVEENFTLALDTFKRLM